MWMLLGGNQSFLKSNVVFILIALFLKFLVIFFF